MALFGLSMPAAEPQAQSLKFTGNYQAMAQFQAGQSGNPRGKPKGVKDKRTGLRALLQPHADALVKKAVDLALGGDTAALRLCLDRLMAPVRPRDEPVELGELQGTLTEQGRAILAAMGRGQLAPSEAGRLLQALAAQARIATVDELEQRIQALEQGSAAR
jgi:hypothetical protein